MKVFLDDLRNEPPGYIRTYWPDEVIKLLKTGRVTHLHLDHDLSCDERGTGADVINWLEEEVIEHDFVPPMEIKVHSSNPSARIRMEAGIESIYRYAKKVLEVDPDDV